VPTYTPLVRQATHFSCGPAALASCLYYWGVWDGRESELYPLLGTTCYDGTSTASILRVAQDFGLSAQYRSQLTIADLKNMMEAGWTCILSMRAWGQYSQNTNFGDIWEDGHYVVLANLTDSDIILMDPSVAGRYAIFSIAQFEARWHDWSDDGQTQEYHTALLLKGESVVDLSQPLRLDT
jgi:predicted double-glycine peptidase